MLQFHSRVGMGSNPVTTSEDDAAKQEALIACAEYQSADIAHKNCMRYCIRRYKTIS